MIKKMEECVLCRKKKRILTSKSICVDCSLKSSRDAVLQMLRKEGPVYDKWKKGIIGLAEKLKAKKDERKGNRKAKRRR